jgi:hypothetical protein
VNSMCHPFAPHHGSIQVPSSLPMPTCRRLVWPAINFSDGSANSDCTLFMLLDVALLFVASGGKLSQIAFDFANSFSASMPSSLLLPSDVNMDDT